MSAPRVSIVVNNFNYARYLPQAIESALNQTYANLEVVVVDDGSSDESPAILRAYQHHVRVVIKGNGGQASSLNVGFTGCSGDFICFLDSDDALFPDALTHAMAVATEDQLVKVHWPLVEIGPDGAKTGRLRPNVSLSHGDLRAAVVENGPEAITYPPTSGNLWARSFLVRVFPLPEVDGYRLGGSDTYLSNLAPLYGRIGRVEEPQGLYRLHGGNNYSSLRFEQKLRQNLWGFEDCCRALADHCRAAGIEPNVDIWKERSWLHRFVRARAELAAIIPAGAPIVLVDNGDVGAELVAGRLALPFRERDGEYWGPPDNDREAIAELERLRSRQVAFVVFAWPAFWWLDHYAGFRADLERRFRCVLRNDLVIVFDVQRETCEAA